MAPNAQATLSGHAYSLEGSSSVIVDGSTYSLSPTENACVVQIMPTNTESSGPITLANGLIVTPVTSADKPGVNPALDLPNGVVISAGGPSAVVSGTTYSVLPSNYRLLVNGASTLTLPPKPSPSFFTVDRKIFTAASNGFYLAGGTILPSGADVTVSGVDVRLGTNSALHIGSATLATSGPASTNGVGGAIVAAFKAPASDQKAAATRKEASGFGLAGALGAGVGTLTYLI
ncbi:hypothetical protein OEA41_004675 [Lepraria neglecta]|uniref:Uncharacterized protein n=1 Tax=Lepraria neglecta TaxID=209136 RepID=A0AAD9YYB3_9LECA|nr:hypothetical protein OEA41_004675 [Lepraria neglecta]